MVVNMSTSRVVEDLATRFGCTCPAHRRSARRTSSGQMREANAVIGGEGNGGVIDPRVGWVRDPFIGMGLILNLMAETGKPLAQLVAELPPYAIVKDKYDGAAGEAAAVVPALKSDWPEATANREDGLRLDGPTAGCTFAASNTEPVVRVIAEAPTEEEREGTVR